MRCIEILTMFNNIDEPAEININMRCIEICYKLLDNMLHQVININMRCIEIVSCLAVPFLPSGLTLTWDVLKYKSIS